MLYCRCGIGILLKGIPGEPYNVSNEQGRITIRNLAETLCKLYPEKNLQVIIQAPNSNYLENQHKIHSNYNTEKLKCLGWNPRYTIEEGFRRTIESFKND